jgi:putative flippase GtrA
LVELPKAEAPKSRLRAVVQKAWKSWATKSLAAGALATIVDILVGLGLLELFDALKLGFDAHRAVSIAAMVGVAVGTVVSFLANRFFAFKEKNPKLAAPAVKFLIATGVAMLVHGQLVAYLKVHYAVPYPIAKMVADVAVFLVGQLLILRYIVFPKKKGEPDVLNQSALDPEQ